MSSAEHSLVSLSRSVSRHRTAARETRPGGRLNIPGNRYSLSYKGRRQGFLFCPVMGRPVT